MILVVPETSYEDIFWRGEFEEITIETTRVGGQEREEEVVRKASDEHLYSIPTDVTASSYLVPTITHHAAGLQEQEQAVGETPGSYTVVYSELLPLQREVISGGEKIERPLSDLSLLGGPETEEKRQSKEKKQSKAGIYDKLSDALVSAEVTRESKAGIYDKLSDALVSAEVTRLSDSTELVALSGTLEGLSSSQWEPVLEGTQEKEGEDPSKWQSLSIKKKNQYTLHSTLGGREIAGGGEITNFENKKSSHTLVTRSAGYITLKKKSFNGRRYSNLQDRGDLQDSGSTLQDSKGALLEKEHVLQDSGNSLHDRVGGLQDKGSSLHDVYSLVDMSGKKKYRFESDALKKEGSGVPQRYTVKEKPSESYGGQEKEEVT